MKTFLIILLGVLLGVLVIAGLAAWRYVNCDAACSEADVKIERLFDRGEFLSALMLIDKIDARCNCGRFTSGDPPSQYSLAQACFRQLSSDGRTAEMEMLLANAQGPILKEFWAARKKTIKPQK